MELSENNFQTLAKYLSETLDPNPQVRRPAEAFLQEIELNVQFPQLLLQLTQKENYPIVVRSAAAINFKNYIKRNWNAHEDDNSADRIHETDRNAIKTLIVQLMLQSPASIQKQLSDAVSIIGKYDFPAKWPKLIDEMVEKFATGDFNVINGVLQTAHSLFKRYRYEFKSQTLWEEIKLVLERLAQPLTELLLATMNLTTVHATNKEALQIIYGSLMLVCKVFYSLNCQDLPEYFEDNIDKWMTCFHSMLITDVRILATEDHEPEGIMEQLRSQICENISLYAQKYDEEFESYMPKFVTAIWELLVATNSETKYDSLVSNALRFLLHVAEKNHYRHLFVQPNVLESICEKVVIPNMQIRVSDEELFEDNPEEYIRRDIEGSDIDTRRRAACDLIKTLSIHFEEKIFQIFGQYIEILLKKYQESPTANWRSKNATICIVMSLASRGSTQKLGVTQTTELVPLSQFCRDQILPEIHRQNLEEFVLLKADALKFVITFRNLLDSQIIMSIFPEIVKHLQVKSVVVHSYAACAIEKILLLKDSNGKPMIASATLSSVAGELLRNLFGVFDLPGSNENDYAMKAIMRSFSTLGPAIMPYMANSLPKLTEMLGVVAKNPSKPHFNHYLFETISLAIKIVCQIEPNAVESFETALFPMFQSILQQDIVEFMPYVFQILSLLLEVREGKVQIPEPYWALFPCLLSATLWDRPGNVTPLIRLLCTFIKQGSIEIVAKKKLNSILGVFQKMIASKANDHEGFYLLQNIIIYYPTSELQECLRQIFTLLFQRLSLSKTTKYVRGIILFFSVYVCKFGVAPLISLTDGIQANMFGLVLEKIFIADIRKISADEDKKIAGVGVAKILFENCELLNSGYRQFWLPLFTTLLQMYELPPEETTLCRDYIEVDDTPGYQVAYVQLNFAQPKGKDFIADIPEGKKYLVETLMKFRETQPAMFQELIGQMASDHIEILKKYCTEFGVSFF